MNVSGGHGVNVGGANMNVSGHGVNVGGSNMNV